MCSFVLYSIYYYIETYILKRIIFSYTYEFAYYLYIVLHIDQMFSSLWILCNVKKLK